MTSVDRFGSITELRTGRIWTSTDIADAVEARAAFLRAQGVAPRDRVVFCQRGSGSFFADLFATWRIGACAVCLSPNITPSELENIVEFVEAAVVLVDEEARDLDIPCISLAQERLTYVEKAAVRGNTQTPDDDALILLTSGTTGTPKAVVHSFRGLFTRLDLNRQVVGADALARTLCLLPVHFGHGLIGGSLTPLLAGHHLVIASDMGPGVLRSLDRIIDEHQITFTTSVPATWRSVAAFCHRRPCRPLTRVHVGSAPLSAGLTGDLAEIDREGVIELRGRLGHEINRGGVKVQPQDIEQTLERHQHVKEACAFAVDDRILGQRVGIAVVLARDAKVELSELKKWLASRLSREKLPDRWYSIEQIPRTERGKVDRPAVARRCRDSRERKAPIRPS